MLKPVISIFTDGACRHNPGPGGWGFLFAAPSENLLIEQGDCSFETTNNRMEMTAVLSVFKFYLENSFAPSSLHVYTDSKHVIDGLTKWVSLWEKKSWKTSLGKDVLNQDLWKELKENMEQVKKSCDIQFHHVPAHVGLVLNERVDKIATTCSLKQKSYQYKSSFLEYPHKNEFKNLEEKIRRAFAVKSKSSRQKQKAYSYVSMISGEIKTHKTWGECQSRVSGASGARFKKALSGEEEASIIEAWTKN